MSNTRKKSSLKSKSAVPDSKTSDLDSPRGNNTRQRMLDLIRGSSHRPATVRELATQLGLSSPASVHRHLKKLEEAGLITRVSGGGSRSWSPVIEDQADSPRPDSIPVVGRIAAGRPIESCLESGQQPEEWIDMPPSAFGQKDHVVALTVEGHSMQDAGIHNGDLAIIRNQPTVENGEIAAITIEGEGTLKRWRKKTDASQETRIILEAAHPDFPPLELNSEMGSIKVFGKLVGLVRRFVQNR